MKRKLTKTISWLLMAVLLLLLTSACSKDSGTNSQGNNKNSLNNKYNSLSENDIENKPEHLTKVPNGYIGIYTVEDLQNSSLNTDANYILMNELDLSSISDWKGITNNSIFDGNNYTISNLKSTHCGLFSNAKNIQNLSLNNIDIIISTETYELGSLAGTAYKVENCNSNGTIMISRSENDIGDCNIGGLIGDASDCTINNCISNIKITHKSSSYNNNIGGVLGECRYGRSLSIENCKFLGTIHAENANIGGIVGKCHDEEVKISYTSNTGNIKCDYSANSKYADIMTVGGIIGCKVNDYNNTIIENCFNSGTIIGNIGNINIDKSTNYKYYFAGIIGNCRSDLNIRNCYNSTAIDIQNNIANIGGITGNKYPDGLYITNCAYLKNDLYGITSTKAMFENCKAMTENEMKDINNYPFDNTNEWKNTSNSYPIYNYTNIEE